MQAGASAASESPQAHTQFVLASLLYSGNKGSSLVMWDPVSASTLELEPWFPALGETGMDWPLPVAGHLGPTRS